MAKCQRCGKPASFLSELCDECTWEAMGGNENLPPDSEHSSTVPVSPTLSSSTSDSGAMVFWALIGSIVGVLLGYLFRPAVPFIGQQLPFTAVITRGASLQGMDSLLVGIAQQSFNYLVLGALICGAIGAFLGYAQKGRDQDTRAPFGAGNPPQPVDSYRGPSASGAASVATPVTVQLGYSRESVVVALGTPQKIMDLGPKLIYVYSDLKITFVDGKVADVQ